jgi:hypothetical protein
VWPFGPPLSLDLSQEFYAALVGKGMKQPMARLTLARKIALIGEVL